MDNNTNLKLSEIHRDEGSMVKKICDIQASSTAEREQIVQWGHDLRFIRVPCVAKVGLFASVRIFTSM